MYGRGGWRPEGPMQMGWGVGPWMLLGLLLVVALATTVVVLLVKLNRVRAGASSAAVAGRATPPAAGVPAPVVPRDALALLDERLARGDIDVADYEARRRALTGEPGASETRVDPLA